MNPNTRKYIVKWIEENSKFSVEPEKIDSDLENQLNDLFGSLDEKNQLFLEAEKEGEIFCETSYNPDPMILQHISMSIPFEQVIPIQTSVIKAASQMIDQKAWPILYMAAAVATSEPYQDHANLYYRIAVLIKEGLTPAGKELESEIAESMGILQ